MVTLAGMMRFKLLQTKTKTRIHKTVVLNGSEAWIFNKNYAERLEQWKGKLLRVAKDNNRQQRQETNEYQVHIGTQINCKKYELKKCIL